MNEESTLWIGGYTKPEPGDMLRVYRNDQCIGWINWSLRTEVGSKDFNQFDWCYTHGGVGRGGTVYSLEDAINEMTGAFLGHMDDMGCTVVGPSRKPKKEMVEPQDRVNYLISELKERKTCHLVDGFMASKLVKREFREMPRYYRSQVTAAASEHHAELYAKENPEGAQR